MRRFWLPTAVLALTVGIPAPALAQCAPLPDGAVSWWPAAGDATDILSGNDGTLVGATTFAAGMVGQAFKFGGFHDQVQIGNPANLQLQSFTIEGWISRASAHAASLEAGGGVLFNYGHLGYGIGLVDDGRLILTKTDVSAVDSGSLTITDLDFHHVAVTKSASTVVFYVDGAPSTPQLYDVVFEFPTSAAIGARGDNLNNSFLGIIDELTIYNRALTADEIQAIVAAGSFGKCQPGGCGCGFPAANP